MEEPKMPANVHDTIYESLQMALDNLHNFDVQRIDSIKIIEALDWCMAYGAFLYEKDCIQGRD